MTDLSVSDLNNNDYKAEVNDIEDIQDKVLGKYNKLFEPNDKYF